MHLAVSSNGSRAALVLSSGSTRHGQACLGRAWCSTSGVGRDFGDDKGRFQTREASVEGRQEAGNHCLECGSGWIRFRPFRCVFEEQRSPVALARKSDEELALMIEDAPLHVDLDDFARLTDHDDPSVPDSMKKGVSIVGHRALWCGRGAWTTVRESPSARSVCFSVWSKNGEGHRIVFSQQPSVAVQSRWRG